MEYVNSLNMHQVQYRKRTIVIKTISDLLLCWTVLSYSYFRSHFLLKLSKQLEVVLHFAHGNCYHGR